MNNNEEFQGSYIRQSLVFVCNSEAEAFADDELRITTDDDASAFFWAAQWLDEHREYFVTRVELSSSGDEGNTLDSTRTLTLHVHNANERAKPMLGPWSHGVPPLT